MHAEHKNEQRGHQRAAANARQADQDANDEPGKDVELVSDKGVQEVHRIVSPGFG